WAFSISCPGAALPCRAPPGSTRPSFAPPSWASTAKPR
ncbi:MAG: hypothetical protein AVDCRST_MAG15-2135, partial [uncultured Rubellimicrobium sp.]